MKKMKWCLMLTFMSLFIYLFLIWFTAFENFSIFAILFSYYFHGCLSQTGGTFLTYIDYSFKVGITKLYFYFACSVGLNTKIKKQQAEHQSVGSVKLKWEKKLFIKRFLRTRKQYAKFLGTNKTSLIKLLWFLASCP